MHPSVTHNSPSSARHLFAQFFCFFPAEAPPPTKAASVAELRQHIWSGQSCRQDSAASINLHKSPQLMRTYRGPTPDWAPQRAHPGTAGGLTSAGEPHLA